MGAILSSAVKNGGMRFVEFLPVSFGLSGFGFIVHDGSGFQKEQVDTTVQNDEPPATQVDLPSWRYLDDLLIPDGIGNLEQTAYNGNRIGTKPKGVIPFYLFSDVQIPNFVQYQNPNHLVQTDFAIQKSLPYSRVYFFIGHAAIYFADEPYESAAQSQKISSNAANYPLVHLALLEQFDPRKEIYNKASLFVSRPKVLTGPAYAPSPHVFPTNAKLLIFEQPKAVEFTIVFPELLNLYTPSTQQSQPTQSKPATRIYTEEIPPQIQELKPITLNSPTLEASVRGTYRQFQIVPVGRQIYDADNHHPTQITILNNLPQQTRTSEPRIEPGLRDFLIPNEIYEKPDKKYAASPYQNPKSEARPAYGQNQVHARAPPQNPTSPKQPRYAGANHPQQNPRLKIDQSSFSRNYDISPEWMNIPNSKFWQKIGSYLGAFTTAKNNFSSQRLRKSPQLKYEQNPEYKKDTEDKSEPKHEEYKEIKPVDDKKIDANEAKKPAKPAYEAKNEDKTKEAETSGTDVKTYEPGNNNKKSDDEEHSLLTYAGTAVNIGVGAAAIGLAGLAMLVSSAFNRAPEAKYELQSPVHQTVNNQTIDSVVAPVQNEKVFTQEFGNDIESIIKRVEQLGYGNVSISIRNNLTGEYYSYGDDKKQKPAPSIVKAGIAFAAAYLAQKGMLNLSKDNKIDFDPESDIDKDLILQRETDDYSQFKNKNKFSYDELRSLMIRDSVNTATNLVLKFIGEGNAYEGMRRVNEVMKEVGLSNTIVEVLYNRISEYTRNATTGEDAEKLMGYILQGKHLKAEYLSPLKEDLENERHLRAFRVMLPGIKSGTKVTIYKGGTGFAAYLGDYSASVLFNDSKTELYADMARSASDITEEQNERTINNPENETTSQSSERRIRSPVYDASNHEIGELFKIFGKYLFKIPQRQTEYKKPA